MLTYIVDYNPILFINAITGPSSKTSEELLRKRIYRVNSNLFLFLINNSSARSDNKAEEVFNYSKI